MLIRLQKILSAAGVASRRRAEDLMTEGRVTLNGVTVQRLGVRADPAVDEIAVDGRVIGRPARLRYILLNKPRGYLCTRSDPAGRPTVLDLLGGVRDYLYPVGRLDYDSEGLLLVTNDGALAARLMHPRHLVEREYEVSVRGVPDRRALERLAKGVVIDGRRTAPAAVRVPAPQRGHHDTQTVLRLILREGRTRQVRKMCEAVGHPVVALRRVRIGPIADATLKPGRARDLTTAEIRRLRDATSATPPPAPERRPTPRIEAPRRRSS